MSRAIAWMVRNPVAANLLMFLLVVGGALTLPTIRQEEFPAIDTDVINISVTYRGAAPAEVEQGVCIRIEEELEGLQDMEKLMSLAVEGACIVTVQLISGSDTAAALDEVESRVNAIDTFPEETERPIVSKFVLLDPVLNIAVTGDLDEASLKLLADEVRDEIAGIPGISQVDVSFVRPYEISIEVSEAALRRHGLSFDEVAAAVRRGSLDIPGGSVKAAGGEILLRTKGQAYTGMEFEEIIVLTRPDGTSVSLAEVATVRDAFRDGDLIARFDGLPAGLVTVQRMGDEDILDIAEKAYAYLEEKRLEVPAGVRLVAFGDEAQSLLVRLNALTRNAASGLVLVLLTLGLFLRFRLAMWVAAGVPIAFLGAFAMFPVFGLTISTLSVMAFILVLGIVVDDAIVIGEAVYLHEQKGVDQVNAAIRGTHDVYIPVIFGVLTTVSAFLPLVILPGPMGQFFSFIGFTAMLCLFFSLLESQWILPSHLAHRRVESKGQGPNRGVATWQRFQGALSGGMERFATERYRRFLRLCLEWRYATVAMALGVLILTTALFASGRLRYQFFPAVEGNVVYATLTMPRGIPVSATETAIRDIEAAVEELRAELDLGREGPSTIRQVFTTIGKQQARDGPPDIGINVGGSHLAEVSIEMVPHSEREVGSYEVAKRWRQLTGSIPDAVELAFSADAFSTGQPIDIELRGGSVEMLTRAAAEVRAELVGYTGVFDVADSYRAGKQEVQLDLKPEARPLGITLDDLGRQVRQAFYGEEVQRVQRGRDDVRVMLRYPEDERSSLGFLEEMRIRTRAGVEVPFGAVADVKLGRGYATIRRTERERVVNVTGEIDRSVATPEAVLAEVEKSLPPILASFPGVTYSLEGEQAEHGKAMHGLVRGAVLALILIYALLAVPLSSYSQPLIIMSVIPFGTVGALLGHWIMGWDVVFFSVLGIVALSGVVVNGSLVLVHYVNRARAGGLSILEAVSEAGVVRFRPIVLTSATTFLGLVPLMFEANIQARPMIPMAISLAYGVLFAAFVTLLLVPSLYLVLEDLRALRTRRPSPGGPEPSPVPAASGR
ncbi:MAG: cobalt-zinc-cadmium resistance protein [Deltaproteobacteria bacterium]|nr:cobalt-zinc-cadmium resistance protein [Deltaproteobacteria bacterium]